MSRQLYMSCLRDATELTNMNYLCTFITCSLTVCYVPLKFLDYVTLIAIVLIIIIIITIIMS